MNHLTGELMAIKNKCIGGQSGVSLSSAQIRYDGYKKWAYVSCPYCDKIVRVAVGQDDRRGTFTDHSAVNKAAAPK